MSMSLIEFGKARPRHLAFRAKLQGFLLTGKGKSDVFNNASQCALGIWIEELLSKHLLNFSLVFELRYLHEEYHFVANRIIRLYEQNRVEDARKELDKMDQIDQQLLKVIESLEEEVRSK